MINHIIVVIPNRIFFDDWHYHDHIIRFEEEEEFRRRGWVSNYEVRLWPKDNISRR